VFYTELMTDMLHLLVYLVFFIIVFTHYGLPLHLVGVCACVRARVRVRECVRARASAL
jgi:hypothetical protein